ncbi:MAG: Bax inhibitor-1/YccA family protein [Cyanobacteria bacterium REEB65]|nr:Bax inhibitor-1/YccA family protein [Cyanobacteria bacterium REEB65]
MQSGNPAFSANAFRGLPWAGAEGMSVEGAVNKTLLLFLILFAAGAYTWNQALAGNPGVTAWVSAGAIGGLIVGIATAFKKEWAPVTAPLYAALEGLVLGGVSAIFDQQYHGIALQAVGLTLATLAAMLVAYRSGLVRATPAFQRGIMAATGGVMLFYLASWVASFFLHYSLMGIGGPIGIGISLVIVGIAAFNLVVDFAVIEQGAASRAPKYMEWYGAFGLMVTLVWLYLEILRLLFRIQEMTRE